MITFSNVLNWKLTQYYLLFRYDPEFCVNIYVTTFIVFVPFVFCKIQKNKKIILKYYWNLNLNMKVFS